MKNNVKFALVILSLLLCGNAIAQPVGNEWINTTQQYYKIRVAQEGICRITRGQFFNAGLTFGVNPINLRLYREGVEVPMYVHGQADNSFDFTDYVEFYAQPNKGSSDAGLYYQNTAAQPHQYRSLITDTATYFITWGTALGLRYANNATPTPSGTPEAYYNHETLHLFNTEYYTNLKAGGRNSRSDYTDGEQWASSTYNKGTGYNTVLNTPYVYTAAAPAPSIQILGYGSNNVGPVFGGKNHFVRFFAGQSASSLALLLDTGYYSTAKVLVNKPMNINQIGTTTTVRIFIPDTTIIETSNYHYIKIKYPRTFEMAGASTKILDINTTSASKRLQFTNYNASKILPYIYNITTNTRTKARINGTNCEAMLPANGKVLLMDSTDALAAIDITPVVFNNINTAANYDYILITHNNLLTAANTYANYRRSAAGGSYNVLVMPVSKLYDQFGYGIYNHPLAIRNFMRYLVAQQANAPQHLFLVGKGYNTRDLRQKARCFNDNLVPTWGDVGSDGLFTALVTNAKSHAPGISTGRLSVTNGQQILDYLAKVQAYESAAPAQWQKRVITATAGNNANEKSNFRSYLNQFATHLTGTKLGADTINFDKNTGFAASTVNSKTFLLNEFNKGALMYLFFGHGGYGGTSIDEGLVSEYPNKLATGQFPFLYYNGCVIGDAFGDYLSRGEQLVREPGKCGIGLLSQSAWGYEYYLTQMGVIFSRRFANDDYGQTIGEIVKRSANEMVANNNDDYSITQVQQSVLQCDPAVRMKTLTKPDYKVSFAATQPAYNAYADSIHLNITIENLGNTPPDSVGYRLVRTMPDGTQKTYNYKIKPIATDIDIRIALPNANKCCVSGNNDFFVVIDPLNNIIESNEANNAATYIINIPLGSTVILQPQLNSIVGANGIKLMAQSTNLQAAPQTYTFEIDTTANFNSPIKITNTATSIYAIAATTVNVPLNNTTYFWRVKNAAETTWQQSTFNYTNGSGTGWQQNNFAQFATIKTENIKINTAAKTFDFADNYYQITAKGDVYNTSRIASLGLRYNGTLTTGGSTCGAGLRLTHIKKNTLKITSFTDCAANRQSIAIATNTTAGRIILKNILDTIPAGDYIAIMTHSGTAEYLKYDNLLPSLAAYGVDTNLLKTANGTGYSYTLTAQKANPAYATQSLKYSPSSTQDAAAEAENTLTGKWYTGKLISEKIGPASSWGNFTCNFTSADTVLISVIGINSAGVETQIISPTMSNNINLQAAAPTINTYKYIKIVAQLNDIASRTASQLQSWKVTYTPQAETTIYADATYVPIPDTVLSGDNLTQSLKLKNLSGVPSSIIQETYKIYNASGVAVITYPPTATSGIAAQGTAGDEYLYNLSIMSNTLPAGNYTLVTTLAPSNPTNETYPANNVLCKPFVMKDRVLLAAKAYIQGSYNTSTLMMNDNLRTLNLIPTTEPYTTLLGISLINAGAVTTPSVLAVSGNNAIVDWVAVRLRHKTTPSVIIGTQVALLQRDGDIVAVDGVSPLSFSISAEQYYIEIIHRNHLSITSAQPVALSTAGINAIDFRSPTTPTYGTNAQNNMGGKMAMVSGDANHDKQVNAADFNTKWLPQNGQSYNYILRQADFNLDGQVNAADFNTQWLPNNSRQTQAP